MSTSITRRTRGIAAACASGLVAGLSVLGAGGNASAANEIPPLLVDYDANGSSYIAKPNTTITLGPAKLSTALDALDGSFTGHLVIGSTTTSFKAIGLLPTTATVGFKEAAPVTGKLTTVKGVSTVASTATYFITLRNIKVLGLPAFEGPRCQTAAPVTIGANTPAGGRFNVATGGDLVGTYTIGSFKNCGLSTGLLNLLVPGANNKVALTLSNGRVVG